MGSFLQDLRFGFRLLFKNPGFTWVAVLSLALGIGACSAVFSVIDGVFLRPAAVHRPAELVSIWTLDERKERGLSSYADYLDLRNQTSAFSGVMAYGRRGTILNVNGEGEMALIDVVSPNYFDVLGVKPWLGRAFAAKSVLGEGEESSVLLSYSLWQRRFHGDPGLVGKTIQLSGKEMVVIGIVPAEFRGMGRLSSTLVWTTPKGWSTLVGGDEGFSSHGNRWLEIMARIHDGVGLNQAHVQMETVAARLAQAFPATNKNRSFLMTTEADRRREVLGPSALFLTMVFLVLLISCANVAGLLLARSERRQHEIAMRKALGASSGKLTRQLLTESVSIAVLGGALGLLLTVWAIQLIPNVFSAVGPGSGADIRLDSRVLLFTVISTFMTTFVFGLYPAWKASRVDLATVMKGAQLGNDGSSSRFVVKHLLVVTEIALSVILMTAAGLLLRSFLFSQQIRPGFDTSRQTLMVELAPPELYGYSETQAAALVESLAERIRSIPGVRQVSYARRPPLTGSEAGETARVLIPGRESGNAATEMPIRYNIVAPGFFSTMGTRLVTGRDFNPSDNRLSSKVVIVNEAMARKFSPSKDAVGQWIKIRKDSYQIVGVVEQGRYVSLHEAPQPYLFFPFPQLFSSEVSFFLETSGDYRPVVSAVLKEGRRLDARVPITGATTLREHMDLVMSEERMAAQLLGGIGVLGLFLAAVGLYGVLAVLVSRRIHEIGIRMALGAQPADVRWMVLRQSMKLIFFGVLLGLTISLAASRLLSNFLYGISPMDFVSFAGSLAVVFVVALMASYLPARRATSVDPAIVLRDQ